MGVNGIETQTSYMESVQYTASSQKEARTGEKEKQTSEAKDQYVKSDSKPKDSTRQIYKRDNALVEKLKQDAEARKQQLIDLVQKTLSKQGESYNTLSDLFTAIKEGKVAVDPQEIEQAKKEVAEDGYWGVEKTSDRFVEFAKALTGGDPSKADIMIQALEKGFTEAEKAWGNKLPDICRKTIDVAKEKLSKWEEELSGGETDKSENTDKTEYVK